MPFGCYGCFGNEVELGEQGALRLLQAHFMEALAPLAGLLPALFAAGRDQFISPKQGPFAFDVLKLRQLLPFVVQAGVVFDHGLVAIAAEAFISVGPTQLGANLGAGAPPQLWVVHGPGGIADHR